MRVPTEDDPLTARDRLRRNWKPRGGRAGGKLFSQREIEIIASSKKAVIREGIEANDAKRRTKNEIQALAVPKAVTV